MLQEVLKEAERKMSAVIDSTKREFATIRTGRATPSLLDRVTVDYYGTETPLNQLASISVPEPRMLMVQPWDKSAVKAIEKAILTSDLGLTPSSDGNVIRIPIPPLTEERRKELVKLVRKVAEEKRVAVRNIRRDANEEVKSLEKSGEISEDESRRTQSEIQELTDKYIEQVDELLAAKEKEILEV